MVNIAFSRTTDVKIPSRGTTDSAGIDFYVPNNVSPLVIPPQKSVLIPTGIRVNIEKGWAMVAFNRGGIAVKKNLMVGACVVDSDFQGEVFIHLNNVGKQEEVLVAGEKMIQFLVLPVPEVNMYEILNVKDLYTSTSERGEGCQGSTNHK